MSRPGITEYSGNFKGSRGNYGWKISCDLHDGFLGINQEKEDGRVSDRVLLSPSQVKAMIAFIRKHRPSLLQ